MAAKNQSLHPQVIFHCLFDQQRQLKAGALPGNPDDFPIEFPVELVEFALAVCTRGEGDGPVRMQVIHV